MIIQIDSGEKQMKAKTKFASILMAACILVFLGLPAFARPANLPQDQGTAQTESAQKGEKQKVERSSGKEIGRGGEDIGKGAGNGTESLGKGTAGPLAISLPCIPATPPTISAKAQEALPRTSESVPEKAQPRSAKEVARE
jgi:hypothetical protein